MGHRFDRVTGNDRRWAVTHRLDQAAATALLDEAGWSIESTNSERVRGLTRDNSITFVFPQDDLDPGPDLLDDLSYRLSSTIDGNTTEQPAVTVVGLITSPMHPAATEPDGTNTEDETATPPEAAPGPIETLDFFYSNLTASLSSGDGGFSVDRLAPTVFEAYPTQCPAAMERFADPDLVIAPIAEGLAGPWTWELPDGRSYEVPNATEVTVVLTGRGQAGTESEAHLELINGQYHWFTLCE